ncbi:hypothetical protein [Streptomyces mirabilis]
MVTREPRVRRTRRRTRRTAGACALAAGCVFAHCVPSATASPQEDASRRCATKPLPGSGISYRAFRNKWIGTPYYPPSAAARSEGGHSVVHASWNGSTQTEAWQVLAGSDPHSLSVVVRHAPRSGFETAVTTPTPGPYFKVRALDAKGRVIGDSRVVKLSG